MSDLRVAVVAEGPTDAVLIDAALKAVLPRSFSTVLLQPEATRPAVGTGWCGVFKWCREFAARRTAQLEADPTLPGFDLFVIHVDSDVAECGYGDCGAAIETAARGLPQLPCSRVCPPPADAADEVRTRLMAWLNVTAVGPRTVLCVPSKSVEAWLAAAVLPCTSPLLTGIECSFNVEGRLASLPVKRRIRKTRREYINHAKTITAQWGRVRKLCSQAERFSQEVAAAVP